MELSQLRTLIHVAELGSLSKAADRLHIAQPALSRQVRMLEEELGFALFLRHGRGMVLSEQGKEVLAHAMRVMAEIDEIRATATPADAPLTGEVAIGLPPSVAKAMAVPLIREFRQRMPDATLSISEGLSYSMRESLATGRLDIALLYNAGPSPDVELTPLLEEPLYLVQRHAGKRAQPARSRAVPLRDVAALPLVIPSRPNAIRMLVEGEMANLGCRPNVVLEIDGVAAILDLVEDGAGSAVLSRNAVATSARPHAFSMRPITSPHLRSKLLIAMSSQRPATLTQTAGLDLIRQLARKLLAPG